MADVVVTGAFDDLRSSDVRFLEEAAKSGSLHALLWSDQSIADIEDKAPEFTQDERQYFLEAICYVQQVSVVDVKEPDAIPNLTSSQAKTWVIRERDDNDNKRSFCDTNGISYLIVTEGDLQGFPELPVVPGNPESKKVVVTGCFDWLHTGHVRFFEETSELGDLYVVVGHDENIRLLKGEGHPLLEEAERRYMVQAIRHVKQALISSGEGWMDAEPEIARMQPDRYAVNEDGDKPEKRAFCEEYGLEYIVLKRTPKEGLPRRESTQLRGF